MKELLDYVDVLARAFTTNDYSAGMMTELTEARSAVGDVVDPEGAARRQTEADEARARRRAELQAQLDELAAEESVGPEPTPFPERVDPVTLAEDPDPFLAGPFGGNP